MEKKLQEILEAYRKFFKEYKNLGNENTEGIRLGLPTGNLNRPESNRGCTSELLKLAGYNVEGYEPRHELENPRFMGEENWLEAYARKPSEIFARFGFLNAGIVGKDLIFEQYCLHEPLDLIEAEAKRKSQERLYILFGRKMPKSHLFGVIQKYEVHSWIKNYLFGGKRAEGDIMKYKKFFRAREEKCPSFQSHLDKTSDLGYGKVDLCWGMKSQVAQGLSGESSQVDKLLKELYPDHTLIISTEYPGIVMRELVEFIPEIKIEISGMRYTNPLPEELSSGSIPKALTYVNIMSNKGKSEHIDQLGRGTIVFDCRASGESFKINDLEQIGKPLVKDSTANLMVNMGTEYSIFPGLNVKSETLDEFLFRNFSDPWNANTEEYKLAQFSNLSSFKRKTRKALSLIKHSGYDYFDSQNMGTQNFRYTAYTQLKMAELAFRLKAASIEYGKTRKDSVYYGR